MAEKYEKSLQDSHILHFHGADIRASGSPSRTCGTVPLFRARLV